MKHFLTTSLFSALLIVLVIGCKKKEDENPTPANHTPSSFENQVKKKWSVSTDAASVQRTSASSSDYSTFEFTDKGTYYIIKADKSFLKGNFTLNVGDSTITMDGLGIIYIDEITDTEITFRLVLTGAEDVIPVKATPVAAVSTTNKTFKLVNKWSFKTRTTNGVADENINATFGNGTYYMYVDISEFGTYAVDTNVPGSGSKVGIWKWCDANETAFSTSGDASVEPTCTGNSRASVSYNNNGDLVLTGTINGNVNVDTYEQMP